jgi:hypothetical protein
MTSTREDETGERPPHGRRGGKTTVTDLMVRKTFWIDRDVEDRLRRDAFESGRTEAEIVRQALRDFYGID